MRLMLSPRLKIAVFALALACLPACGSVAKTAYNGLNGLKGAYVGANDIRNAYCAPKPAPKPAVCVDSNKPMDAAYRVLLEGTDLLAQYVATKDSGLAAQLTALSAKIPELILQVTLITADFKSATGVPPPSGAPPAPSH